MCGKLKNVHTFVNVGHSDLLISACLALLSMYICVQGEASMINHIGRRGKYMKKEKWLPLKKIQVVLTKYSMCISTGAYVHTCL